MRYSPNTPALANPNQGYPLQPGYVPAMAAYPVYVPPVEAYPQMPTYEPRVGLLHTDTPEYDEAVAQMAPEVDAIFKDYDLTTADIPQEPPLLVMANAANVYNSADPSNPDGSQTAATGGSMSTGNPVQAPASPAAGGGSGSNGGGTTGGSGRGGFPGGGNGGSSHNGPENNGPEGDDAHIPADLGPVERGEFLEQLQQLVEYAGEQTFPSIQGAQARLGVEEARARQLVEAAQAMDLLEVPADPKQQLIPSRLTGETRLEAARQRVQEMAAREHRLQRSAAIAAYRAGTRSAARTADTANDPATPAAPAAPTVPPVPPTAPAARRPRLGQRLRAVASDARARLRPTSERTPEPITPIDDLMTPELGATPNAAPTTPEAPQASQVDSRILDIATLYKRDQLGMPENAHTLEAARKISDARDNVITETQDLIRSICLQHGWSTEAADKKVLDSEGNQLDANDPDVAVIILAWGMQDTVQREASTAVSTYVGEDLSDPQVRARIAELHTDPTQAGLLSEWEHAHAFDPVRDNSPLLKAFEQDGIYFAPDSYGIGFTLVDASGDPLKDRAGHPITDRSALMLPEIMSAVTYAQQEYTPTVATPNGAPRPRTPAEIQDAVDARIGGFDQLGGVDYEIVAGPDGEDQYVFKYGPNGRRQITANADSWQSVALALDQLRENNDLAASQPQGPNIFVTIPGGVSTVGNTDGSAPDSGNTTPPAPAQAATTGEGSTADTTSSPDVPRRGLPPYQMPSVFEEVYDRNPGVNFYTAEEALTALRRMKVSAAAYHAAEQQLTPGIGLFVDAYGNCAYVDTTMPDTASGYQAHVDFVKEQVDYMGTAPESRTSNRLIETSLYTLPTHGRNRKLSLNNALYDAREFEPAHFDGLRDVMYNYRIRERQPRTPMSRSTRRRLLGGVAGIAMVSTAVVSVAASGAGGARHDQARPEATASASANPGHEATPSPSASATQSPETPSPTATPSHKAKPSPSPSASKTQPTPSASASEAKPSPAEPSADQPAPKPKAPAIPGHEQPGAANDADVSKVHNGPIDVTYNTTSHEANGTIGKGGNTWKLAETILKSAKVDANPAAIQKLTGDILAKGGVDWAEAPHVIDPGSTAKVTVDKDGVHVVSVNLR